MAFQYITNEQLNGFDSYKYSCKDTSPLSNYVMHPFWNNVVKLFPRWIAPNLLTLAGFLFLVSQTIVLTVVDPQLSLGGRVDAIPRWVWFYSAFAHFMAHTLDGIDGKQARRTGSSSPLGEMFDHGLDSWSTSLFVINMFSVFGKDSEGGLSNVEQYVLIWLLCINFLCSHWEKYNTGIMYLPWAYDISCLAIFIIYIVSGINGTTIWSAPIAWLGGYSGTTLMKWSLYGGSVLGWLMAVKNVIDVWRSGSCKQPNLLESVRPWAPLVFVITVLTVWCFVITPYDIIGQKTRLVLILTGILFANIACRLIVVQMSSTRAEIFNPLFLPILAGAAFDGLMQKPYLAPVTWKVICAMCVIMHIHYGIGVVYGLANYLNIKVFKITPINTNTI